MYKLAGAARDAWVIKSPGWVNDLLEAQGHNKVILLFERRTDLLTLLLSVHIS